MTSPTPTAPTALHTITLKVPYETMYALEQIAFDRFLDGGAESTGKALTAVLAEYQTTAPAALRQRMEAALEHLEGARQALSGPEPESE